MYRQIFKRIPKSFLHTSNRGHIAGLSMLSIGQKFNTQRMIEVTDFRKANTLKKFMDRCQVIAITHFGFITRA